MGINERGAGRKRTISEEMLTEIRNRHAKGESITALAQEYGVSRQTLSNYLNEKTNRTKEICTTIRQWAALNKRFRDRNVNDYTMRLDYMSGEELCTTILVNFKERNIAIRNETNDIIHRAFGIKAKPDWQDFEEFLESRCFPRTRVELKQVLEDIGLEFYDPLAIIEKTQGRMAEDFSWIKITYFDPQKAIDRGNKQCEQSR